MFSALEGKVKRVIGYSFLVSLSPTLTHLIIHSVIVMPLFNAAILISFFKSGSTFIDNCVVPLFVMLNSRSFIVLVIISLFHLLFYVGLYIAFTFYSFLYSYIENYIYRSIHSNGWRR